MTDREALASDELQTIAPIVGEVTTGGAWLIGGIAGGIGAGRVGYILGQWAVKRRTTLSPKRLGCLNELAR